MLTRTRVLIVSLSVASQDLLTVPTGQLCTCTRKSLLPLLSPGWPQMCPGISLSGSMASSVWVGTGCPSGKDATLAPPGTLPTAHSGDRALPATGRAQCPHNDSDEP